MVNGMQTYNTKHTQITYRPACIKWDPRTPLLAYNAPLLSRARGWPDVHKVICGQPGRLRAPANSGAAAARVP